MKISTRAVFSIASGRTISRVWYEYDGSVLLGKGASAQQTDLANTQQQFYNTVLQNYNTQFANQGAILSGLTSGWNTIFNAGPGQYGYTPAEDAALRTQATEGTAGEYNKALAAVNQQIGARGGGNTPGVTSGADTQVQAELASAAAAKESSQQLGITTSGYDVGRQNYLAAGSALAGAAGLYNPQSYGSIGTSAGSSAFNAATEVNKENQAASPWNTISGILGGALGAGLNAFTGGIGGMVAGAIPGLGGGGYGGDVAPGTPQS